MLSEGGVAVDVAFLTRGEMGLEPGELPSPDARRNLAEIRTQEARAACSVLGVRNVLFLGGHDTRLADQPELGAEIAGLLRSGEYQRVFCPWAQDGHDDHRATFNLLRSAVSHNHFTSSFWLYEVWKPLPANTFVPIDGTIEAKRRAMDQYQSQLSQLNYREGFAGLSAYRSLFCPSSSFAEAFLVCDKPEILNMT